MLDTSDRVWLLCLIVINRRHTHHHHEYSCNFEHLCTYLAPYTCTGFPLYSQHIDLLLQATAYIVEPHLPQPQIPSVQLIALCALSHAAGRSSCQVWQLDAEWFRVIVSQMVQAKGVGAVRRPLPGAKRSNSANCSSANIMNSVRL